MMTVGMKRVLQARPVPAGIGRELVTNREPAYSPTYMSILGASLSRRLGLAETLHVEGTDVQLGLRLNSGVDMT